MLDGITIRHEFEQTPGDSGHAAGFGVLQSIDRKRIDMTY